MTLYIPPSYKARRQALFEELWDRKQQLIGAYLSESPTRITKAKLSLARILKELAESPELGPRRPFRFGHKLEAILQYGFDPNLSWDSIVATRGDWYQVAFLLERSITYD